MKKRRKERAAHAGEKKTVIPGSPVTLFCYTHEFSNRFYAAPAKKADRGWGLVTIEQGDLVIELCDCSSRSPYWFGYSNADNTVLMHTKTLAAFYCHKALLSVFFEKVIIPQ